jgi:DNA-binding NarL/FixJ family response regulator
VISVVIADDQALVRAGFRALLDAQDDISVVGEASDGDEAVRLALQHRPDVVLMDIRMPGVDGLTATRRIAADDRLGAVKIVILTTFDLDEYVFEAIRVGANGFLVKDTEPAELLRAVRAVVAGDALLSPRVTRRLIEEFAARAKDPARVPEPGGPHRPGAGGRGACGRGPHQRRDRGPPHHERGHGQDPRQPGHDQGRRPGPGPAGGLRLRNGPRPSRLAALTYAR